MLKNVFSGGVNMKENEEFKARKPDYKGEGVAVWLNKKEDREWLSIKAEGLDGTLVAFKNED
jgi:hypothetical protein